MKNIQLHLHKALLEYRLLKILNVRRKPVLIATIKLSFIGFYPTQVSQDRAEGTGNFTSLWSFNEHTQYHPQANRESRSCRIAQLSHCAYRGHECKVHQPGVRFTVLLFIVAVLTLNKLQINKCLTCLSTVFFYIFYIYN